MKEIAFFLKLIVFYCFAVAKQKNCDTLQSGNKYSISVWNRMC